LGGSTWDRRNDNGRDGSAKGWQCSSVLVKFHMIYLFKFTSVFLLEAWVSRSRRGVLEGNPGDGTRASGLGP